MAERIWNPTWDQGDFSVEGRIAKRDCAGVVEDDNCPPLLWQSARFQHALQEACFILERMCIDPCLRLASCGHACASYELQGGRAYIYSLGCIFVVFIPFACHRCCPYVGFEVQQVCSKNESD